MFKLYNANFSTATSQAILRNASVPLRLLEADPIVTKQSSTRMVMSHADHGLFAGDTVVVSGFDSNTTYAGIKGTSIIGARTIDSADNDTLTFDADSAATSSVSIGGFAVNNTQNYSIESVLPYIETNLPQSTRIDVSGKFVSGKSNAGTETPYSQDLSLIHI